MTLYEFNLMPNDQDRYKVVFNEGSFIYSISEGNKKFALYAVNKFFVEVEYDSSLNKILNLISFREGSFLNKYYEQIKLDKKS